MKNKRPLLVTIICILQFMIPLLFVLALLILMFSPVQGEIGGLPLGPLWYLIFSLVWMIFFLVATIFVWKMKKIGLIICTGLIAIKYVVTFASGIGLPGPILSTIAVGLLWIYFKKML